MGTQVYEIVIESDGDGEEDTITIFVEAHNDKEAEEYAKQKLARLYCYREDDEPEEVVLDEYGRWSIETLSARILYISEYCAYVDVENAFGLPSGRIYLKSEHITRDLKPRGAEQAPASPTDWATTITNYAGAIT